MPHLYLRFYEELNDFIHPSKQKQTYQLPYHFKRSIKDLIESEGVPHVEVDLILVNGKPVDFNYIIQPEDQISVYPVFESFDISDVTKINGRPLRHPRFILDVHLGKLAKYLRLFGFNTIYHNAYSDDEIELQAVVENRIVLTRDIGLLKRSNINKGYWLRAQQTKKQLQEVFQRFQLGNQCKPFTLCMVCNGNIRSVDKQDVLHDLMPDTIQSFERFYQCQSCQKIYWKGSHYEKLEKLVESIKTVHTAYH